MMNNGSLNGRRRVVITGLGAVTPLGGDVESTWDGLVAGRSGAGEITQFDSSDYAVHFACEVKDFDATQYIDRKQARRMDRFAHLIVAAARQAEADSGISIESESDRIGAAIATGIGGLKAFQDCHSELLERGPDRVNPFSIPEIIPNMGAAWVSMQLGTQGPLSSQCTACAASNMAIGDGLDAIRLGRADVMLCGGTEAPVTEVGIAGFSAMRALSRRNDDPEGASRPFDSGRDGFVMGEAGAVVVLRSSSTRGPAVRRSTPSCSATASHRTRATSPSPTPRG
jgi:3-oxoacyl-[acyl-carrier-protein] synthase II